MHRGHEYKDLHHVKQEVSGSALSLIQHGVPDNVKVWTAYNTVHTSTECVLFIIEVFIRVHGLFLCI